MNGLSGGKVIMALRAPTEPRSHDKPGGRLLNRFARFSAVVATALTAATAYAQYPTRSIKWVVPYPPAGTTDVLARIMAPCISDKLGQQVIIENKPGGGN